MKRTYLLFAGPLSLVAGLSRAASAADATVPAPDLVHLQADVAQLKQDLREQKQLLLNVMQSEQQRYDVLLQLLKSGSGAAAGATALPAPSSASPPALGRPTPSADLPTPTEGGTATISGHVNLPSGARDAVVYVEGLKGGAGKARLVEITQKNKQFSPQMSVVPVGSHLVFPNADNVFHNVFSKTPGLAFDLGSVKSGERSKPVLMSQPGHLEIFCNIHSKMRADVLVVPNGYYARVDGDGSFQLPGVPVGMRRLVVWGPGLKATAQRVELTAKGANVHLSPAQEPAAPHLNKFGQVYGSYDE